MAAPRTLSALLLLLPCLAGAQPAADGGVDGTVAVVVERPEPPRQYLNMRVGATSASRNGHPELCLEVAPLAFLSLEACGTGSGFLHHDPAPELAHFRGKLRLASWALGGGALQGLLGLGFAELQAGDDAPGFYFTDAGPLGVETAGPEAAAGLRYLQPLGLGLELVAEGTVGLAWLPGARQMRQPQPTLLPSVGLSVGVGF